MTARPKAPKKKPPFVIADSRHISCKECRGRLEYPYIKVPLADFIAEATAFLERHKNCDTEEIFYPAYTAEDIRAGVHLKSDRRG